MGSGIAMDDRNVILGEPKPVWTMDAADVLASAEAIFNYRLSVIAAADPRNSHPMMYSKYLWNKLPVSEQAYYCEMAIAAFRRMGIICPDVALQDS